MLSSILLILAAISNAMMDKLSHHWYKFRWRNKVNEYWWNPAISWKNKYLPKYKDWPVQLTDAWHTFKTIMVVCIVGAIIFYKPIFISEYYAINFILNLAVLTLCWNFTFEFFYHKIFEKK